MRIRNYFLTGIVVVAPISITIFLTWTFVNWIDARVKPLIPPAYNPDTYLPFSVPGFGVLVALVAFTLIGFLTANLVGRSILSYGEQMLDRMPLIRSLYRGLKQIFETVLHERGQSFQNVGLIEYPRRGLWAMVFVSTSVKGEPRARLQGEGGLGDAEAVSVFLPTTPNPTSGFLLFVPKADIIILDMTVEDAAKMVISAGLVTPEYQAKTEALAEEAAPDRVAASREPPSEVVSNGTAPVRRRRTTGKTAAKAPTEANLDPETAGDAAAAGGDDLAPAKPMPRKRAPRRQDTQKPAEKPEVPAE